MKCSVSCSSVTKGLRPSTSPSINVINFTSNIGRTDQPFDDFDMFFNAALEYELLLIPVTPRGV